MIRKEAFIPSRPKWAARAAVFLLSMVLVVPAAAQEARWKELDAQVEQLHKQGQYPEALPVAQEALRVAEVTFGPEHANTATALDKLGKVYLAQGKYADAEPLFRRSLTLREKALGPEHPDVATSLNNLANLYRAQGRYAEAGPLYKRALAIREKALGSDHPDVAKSLTNLAVLYNARGRVAEAEPLYKRALAIWEKVLGPDHPDVTITLNNLATLYDAQGRYAEAEPLYKRALAIREKALGLDHPHVAISLNNLAEFYRSQGRYADAGPLYKRALAIMEKALGPDHPDAAISLNNLANFYNDQGRYAEAEPLHKRALATMEKVLGPDHPNVAESLNKLAILYRDQGRYAEAEPLYKRALAIREKVLGPEHPNVASSLNNLAILYRDQGRYGEAEPLAKRALIIWAKALGPEHPNVASSLNNLAILYRAQGRYAEAEPLQKRGLATMEKVLGPEHPGVAESLNNLAILYRAQGRYAEAEPLYKRGLENLARQFQYHFSYMSEKDRLSFLDTVANTFASYFSFCLTNKDRNPALAGQMYDVVLWQKGLVANSIAALRRQIAASGDKDSLNLLERLTAKRTQLVALLTAQPKNRQEWRKSVDELEHESNDLEQQLVRRSGALAEDKRLAHATWRDVQKALGKDEAAVEFVRFRFDDGKRLTETAYYVVLIITPETKTAPKLVLLGDAAKLERAPINDYRQRARLLISPGAAVQPSFYAAFWKPLEKELAGKRRLYISPDGVLNQVSLGIVPDSHGEPLIERYDLRLVSSSKDLLRERRKDAADTATLIGDPKFDLDEAEQRLAAQSFRKAETSPPALVVDASGLRSGELRGEALAPLPGAEAELRTVSSLLSKRGWHVEVYREENALEETVKRVRSPRVLHLATHGFFLPDQERLKGDASRGLPSGAEDPMLRSGLYFAGANRVLSGAPPAPDMEDGVLTAYEASGLNLQGTELVVLSACKTGLGEVKNGEGVFGLRRALQEAGAESVLMSLWSVPDRETQELMTLFYAKWLSGMDKHEALRAAQLEMRRRVKARYEEDLQFYWGAFVLVGR